jgi:hypothetical protein
MSSARGYGGSAGLDQDDQFSSNKPLKVMYAGIPQFFLGRLLAKRPKLPHHLPDAPNPFS